MNEKEKKVDAYSVKSAKLLKQRTKKNITGLFKLCLDMAELKFGDDFEGYEEFRSKILRVGNDAIREFEESLDNNFNVEFVPDKLTVYFKDGKNNGKKNL